MNGKNEAGYFDISLSTAEAILADEGLGFAFFLPHEGENGPVLYSEAGKGFSPEDLRRLAANGISQLRVQARDLHSLEARLEQRLETVLSHRAIPPAEKAKLVYHVGTSIARDIVTNPTESEGIERSDRMINGVIRSVLQDPAIGANMLKMAGHERTTASHMFVVSILAILLGTEVYGSDLEPLRALGLAGMMHDLGKLSIPPEILNKQGPLTEEEMELVYRHPIESVRLLGDDPHVTPPVRQAILQHHERPDGRGYPLGLRGEEVLPASRMLTIVDSFHAMISRRPYRSPLTPEQAVRAMQTQAGAQFDADLLAAWEAVLKRHADSMSVLFHSPPGSGEDLSTRHEHRPAERGRTRYGQRAKRFRCDRKIQVRCVYAGRLTDATCAPDEFTALLHDVSRGGLCLYSTYPMYPGEVIHVEIPGREGPVWIRGKVVWCRPFEGITYRVGVQFTERISQAEAMAGAMIEGLDHARTPEAQRGSLPVWRRVGPSSRTEPAPAQPTPAAASSCPPARVSAPPVVERIPPPPQPAPEAVPTDRKQAMELLRRMQRTPNPSVDQERTVIALSAFSDPEVRRAAVEVLTRIASKPARAAIAQRIHDPDPRVQIQAVGAAGLLRMFEAQYALRQLVKGDDTAMALRAAGALGRLEDDLGLPLVVRTLQYGEGETVLIAARALGEIVGKRFPANSRGVEEARRYVASRPSLLASVA